MNSKKDVCVICAYRATCQKKFSLPAGRHCPEFARDYLIKEEPEETTAGTGETKK